LKFKSDFERRVYDSIFNRGGVCEYEPFSIPYVKTSKYTPDFVLHNGIIIETKGRFVAQDRSKHLLVRKQYPRYDRPPPPGDRNPLEQLDIQGSQR